MLKKLSYLVFVVDDTAPQAVGDEEITLQMQNALATQEHEFGVRDARIITLSEPEFIAEPQDTTKRTFLPPRTGDDNG